MGIFTPPLAPRGGKFGPPLLDSQVEISARLHHCLPWHQLCGALALGVTQVLAGTARRQLKHFLYTHSVPVAPGVPGCRGGGKPSAVRTFGAFWKSWMPGSPSTGATGAVVWGDASWSVCFAGDVRVPLWVKKGGMKFPADPDTPVIMIGPGTGVAPFRAAVQERVAQGHRGEEQSWEGLGMLLAALVCVQHTARRDWGLLRVWAGQGFAVLSGSKLGSGAGEDQSLVCAACMVIHRLC